MSTSISYKHYLRAISRWPKDHLRPDIQFQDAMRRRIERRINAPKPLNSDPNAPSPAVVEKYEMEQANILYSLLENRYSKAYPLQANLMKPESNPTYYEDLVKELAIDAKRPWYSRALKRLSGLVRFK